MTRRWAGISRSDRYALRTEPRMSVPLPMSRLPSACSNSALREVKVWRTLTSPEKLISSARLCSGSDATKPWNRFFILSRR